MLSLIVAVARNGVIGVRGDLPWKLSSDLRRFKRLTMGHHLIMGRVTYESIGRPLPGRTTIVITHDRDYAVPGVLVAHQWDDAIHLANEDDEVFVVGGRQIYELALPHVDRIYWTDVVADTDGDTFFPSVDWRAWRQVSEEGCAADEKNDYSSWFRVYERRSADQVDIDS